MQDLEIEASGSTKTITVGVLPYSTTAANTLSYLSCYYHIFAALHTWEEGAKLSVTVTAATDVSLYLLGGNSRDNASIALIASNASATVGTVYTTDISTEMIIVALPATNKTGGTYTLTYTIDGSEYNWW